MPEKLVIVDYGMGNIWSVASAIRYLGTECVVSDDPAVVAKADALILPGVGSFYKAMQTLDDTGLSVVLRESVAVKKRKILGICLGLQLLAEKGTEDGVRAGLGLIPGMVDRFDSEELRGLKVPHIGFNSVSHSLDSVLFRGITAHADFYFVHSYRLVAGNLPGKAAICHYGAEFMAAYEYENVYATQFHPEKSQTNGLRLLSNFLTA